MLFSVIVPIYNIEKYLNRCIESVLSQSFTDYELILVDDGSPDNCPRICDEYAAADSRIKVIHKGNGGLVSARQAGITVAAGDYVFNLDGDDALCEGALESAYNIISETNADVVSFSYKLCVNGEATETVDEILPEGYYNKSQIEELIFPRLLSDKDMKHMFYFLWGKAIKRELAIKHQMNVNRAISIGEDISCVVPCYLEARSVYLSRKAAYLYTVRNDSLSTDFKTAQIIHVADTIIGLRNLEIKKPADFEEQIARYSCFMCFAILALAAEGGYFKAIDKLRELIVDSLHMEEIRRACFDNVSIKTRISIFLMKKKKIKFAFYFLFLCKEIKRIGKRDS